MIKQWRPSGWVIGRWGVVGSLLLAFLCVATPSAADVVFTPEDGWFFASEARAATPEELLARGDQAFVDKDYGAAERLYTDLIRYFPEFPQVEAVILRKLEAQFLGRRYDAALLTIEGVLRRKPDRETLLQVLRRKYDIGEAFITGSKRHILGIPVSAGSYGAEILDSIATKYKYLPFSDDALFLVAGYYFKRKRYAEAEFVYEKLIEDYPQREWVGVAEYQIGVAAMRRLKGVEYDMAPLDKAERYFRRYLSNYPGGDRVDETRDHLRRIDAMRAERLYKVAQFYVRIEKPRAASLYLQRLLRDHPNAPSATQGRVELERLAKGWVQE